MEETGFRRAAGQVAEVAREAFPSTRGVPGASQHLHDSKLISKYEESGVRCAVMEFEDGGVEKNEPLKPGGGGGGGGAAIRTVLAVKLQDKRSDKPSSNQK
jgi:hypothetical protein